MRWLRTSGRSKSGRRIARKTSKIAPTWLSAEIARVEGREFEAERLYEAAIKSARKNKFVHNEASPTSWRRVSILTRGFEGFANVYVWRMPGWAICGWGADGKVQQLDQLHPRLTPDERAPGPTSTIEAPTEQLDIATVIEVSASALLRGSARKARQQAHACGDQARRR